MCESTHIFLRLPLFIKVNLVREFIMRVYRSTLFTVQISTIGEDRGIEDSRIVGMYVGVCQDAVRAVLKLL